MQVRKAMHLQTTDIQFKLVMEKEDFSLLPINATAHAWCNCNKKLLLSLMSLTNYHNWKMDSLELSAEDPTTDPLEAADRINISLF